jgi:hypothetical protein
MMKGKYRLLINLLSLQQPELMSHFCTFTLNSSKGYFQLYHCVSEVLVQYHEQSFKDPGKSHLYSYKGINCRSMFCLQSSLFSLEAWEAIKWSEFKNALIYII